MLLRKVVLQEVSTAEEAEILTLNLMQPNNENQTRQKRLAVSMDGLKELTIATDFAYVEFPHMNSCHWLDKTECLTIGDVPTTWTCAANPAKGSNVSATHSTGVLRQVCFGGGHKIPLWE